MLENIFADPTYIVLNVPSPAADAVREIRRQFEPARADMSVEITLAGSGGLGTVLEGQSPETVFAAVDRIAAATEPFTAYFGEINRFSDSGICYYTVQPIEPFVEIQQMLAESPVLFTPCSFPYTPHCTLILYEDEQDLRLQELQRRPRLNTGFILDTISVYSLTDNMLEPVLLHRANFSMKLIGYT